MLTEVETEGQDLSTDTATGESDNVETQGSDSEQLDAAATEQADAQDPNAEENEEDNQEEPAATPKEKSGNFDWKKINEKLGSDQLQRSHLEAQRTISRFSQENKTLKEQLGSFEQTSAPLREAKETLDWFNGLLEQHPDLRTQIQAKLAGKQPQAGVTNQAPALPPGVNPEDPLAPVVLELQRGYQTLAEQSRQAQIQAQQQQIQSQFRQGLVEAKAKFEQEIGRKPSEQELKMVAERMRALNYLKGGDIVPMLFVNEIRKHEAAKLQASRAQKKNLPKSLTGGRQGTSKPKSDREAFDEAWAKEFGD